MLVLHYTYIYEQNKITRIFLKKCFITPTKTSMWEISLQAATKILWKLTFKCY